MTAQLLDGEAAAAAVKDDLRARIAALEERGVTPGLGTILVGDDGPSAKYVGMKHADAAELGMHTSDIRLPATATQAEVAKFSRRDAEALPAYYAMLDRVADVLRELVHRTPPDVANPAPREKLLKSPAI